MKSSARRAHKTFFAAAVLAALLMCGNLTLFAAAGTVVSSATRLDLRHGSISGEKAFYSMDIPELWRAYLLADRVKSAQTDGSIEKLIFYYRPQDDLTKPIPVLCITVYGKDKYTSAPEFSVFLETHKYYFAYRCTEEMELQNEVDQAIVNQILTKAEDDIFLSSLIWPSSDDEKVFTNTLWVNGMQLHAYPYKQSNVTLLPIRDVCEALGYSVGWIADRRAVTVAKPGEYYLLLADNPNVNDGYPIVIKNDKSYISSLYFATHMKVNIQVDERSNVSIY
ncbi:MAG: copper amine oxidase N-terminal domain-containing protein [Firmicutes bacterium]|nr:copper amine oxidase N-terminal domain-containing protein [Bacillota bacterium]